MMDASLDTDIVIHLYVSGRKDLLFSSFDELVMYEYLFEKELKNKSPMVYAEFSADVENGYVKIITHADLIGMGIKGLFEEYKDSNQCLFDQGELHAIALAKAMGIAAFVSDDTKPQGPHHTLVQEIIEDVIPFAFYELLFLKYISSVITLQEMFEEFEAVTSASMSEHPMNFRSKILSAVRRFSARDGSNRDLEWIRNFCSQKNINLNDKMRELKPFLASLS